ncbi:MAG: hypothetical protein EXX96DRAFT_618487 [Benjaminiella poitrasii]|nr:MAG: hypothetical protein EXX96DRAFT_618487 [Benjaminiella poitrasii]
MGRLEDNQYVPFQQSVKKKKKEIHVKQDRNKDEAKLQAIFCPPLDPSLIQAIWNDTYDYNASFEVLTALAKEANETLDQQGIISSMDQLELGESSVASVTTATTETTESEDENVNFLMTCFPTLPAEDLIDVLQSQGNDVEKATDLLLNRDYIQQNGSNEGFTVDGIKAKQNHKKKKKKESTEKKKVWSSGQLPTIGATHGHTANPGAISKNMRTMREKEEEMQSSDDYWYDGIASVPFNVWHQYDDRINRLETYFKKIPRAEISAYVQHCRGNVIASVKKIMEKYPDEKPQHVFAWVNMKEWLLVKDELKNIMVDRTADDTSRVALGVIIEELIQENSKKKTIEQLVQTGIEYFLTFDISQLDLEARLKKMAKETDMIRAKAKKEDIPVVPDYLLINNEGSYEEDDPDECRNIAMELIIERNELFRKAATAYRQARNKGSGEGGIAFYYSDTARQIDSKARDWNMRAARATVRGHRLRQKDDHLLDLHGLTVAEAQAVVKEGVNQWFSRSQVQSARREFKPLKIVTGAGKHSQYGEAKLLPTTLKILKKEGWSYDMPHPGCIYVRGIRK